MVTMLQWLAATRWSVTLHESVYVWPLLESVHVLCLALFVGTAVMLDLRLLGVAMTHVPASAFTQRLLPWTRGAFVIMVVTGVLLFTATPFTSDTTAPVATSLSSTSPVVVSPTLDTL